MYRLHPSMEYLSNVKPVYCMIYKYVVVIELALASATCSTHQHFKSM